MGETAMRGVVMSVVGAAGLAGLGYGIMPGGEVYPLPASDVEAKLRAMDLSEQLGVNRANSVNDVVIEGDPGHSVIWRLRTRGQSVGWVEAKIVPVSADQTRVTVDFQMSELGPLKRKAELVNRQDFIRAVGVAAIGEAVDATLEDREYDKRSVERRIAAYAITHPQQVAQFRDNIGELGEFGKSTTSDSSPRSPTPFDARHPEAAAAERQYEAERAMKAAGAPTVDPARAALDSEER